MSIERILKRCFPGITLLLIAVVAYLQARGIVQLLTLALAGPLERGSLPPPRHLNPAVPTAPETKAALVGRPPFDSAAPSPGNAPARASLAMPTNVATPWRSAAPEPMSAFIGADAPPRVDQGPLAQLGSLRVVPEQKAGKVVGLRLFGVRPSSLLGTLGLKNGDRLDSINGFEVSNPEQALEAYARLRSAPRLRLRLDRAGRAVEIDLNII